MSSQESSSSSSSSSCSSFIGLVLSIIILANASHEEFSQLGITCYYNFILFIPISIGATLLLTVLSSCLLGSNPQLLESHSSCLRLMGGIWLVSLLITLYTLIGIIWYQDPHHSVIFYKEFWSELVVDKSVNNAWVFIMADIIVRLASSIVIFITMLMLPIMCIFKVIFTHEKTINNMTPDSFSSQL